MLPDNQNGMLGGDSSSSSSSYWTRVQDKLFEQALAIHPEETNDRWRKIAGEVPGKTEWEVKKHYEELVHDVREIESGRVDLPGHAADDQSLSCWDEKSQISFSPASSHSGWTKRIPWTEDEHKRFLIGLQKYGKGDWRNISRNVVLSRTPTQVASHAQKYYINLHLENAKKRSSSIRDKTTVEEDPASQHHHPNLVPRLHSRM